MAAVVNGKEKEKTRRPATDKTQQIEHEREKKERNL